MEAQREVSRRCIEGLVGRVLPVLVEGVHPETELLLSGRLSIHAPEVDGGVLITRGTGIEGEIMRARVTAAHDYDLEAELL
jgi:ribosomal protein S12 methylthiotransferase